MCSPCEPGSPESSTSSSPAAPLPLHDDDDHITQSEDENSKDEATESLWCTDVICPAFTSSADPSQIRCQPPTPPFPSDHFTSQSAIKNPSPSANYSVFHSPTLPAQVHSPNLSPIDGRPRVSASCRVPFASPDLSPIQNCKENVAPDIGYASLSKTVTRDACETSTPEPRTSANIPHDSENSNGVHCVSDVQMPQQKEENTDSKAMSSKHLDEVDVTDNICKQRIVADSGCSEGHEVNKEGNQTSHNNLSPEVMFASSNKGTPSSRTPSSKTEKRSSSNSVRII